MVPIALFDKSFVQGLNVNESVFFDKFFMTVLCPIFYVETLADLAKAVREGRTPEDEVGFIAAKTPELGVAVCANHQLLCFNSFLRNSPPMNGRVPRAMGREVRVNGKRGVVYEQSQEEEAFLRWQQRRFMEVEHRFARVWRERLKRDASGIRASLGLLGVNPAECKTLAEAKSMAEAFVASTDTPLDRLNIGRLALGLSDHAEDTMYRQWKEAGFPPLPTFAPYAAYVFTVEFFFHIAVEAQLLTDDHRMDMAYLYYLPFCNLFVSSDKAHRRCAPLFMRADQEFIWGQDLKANLKQIAAHYLTFSETDRERGIFQLAPVPPAEAEGLVARIYDQHCGPLWRNRRTQGPPDQSEHPKVLAAVKELASLPTQPADKVDPAEEVMMMRVNRYIYRKRGDFYSAPKGTPDAPI